LRVDFFVVGPLIAGQPFRGVAHVGSHWRIELSSVRIELHSTASVERRYLIGSAAFRGRYYLPFEIDAPGELETGGDARFVLWAERRGKTPTSLHRAIRVSAPERAAETPPTGSEKWIDACETVARAYGMTRPMPHVLHRRCAAVALRVQYESGRGIVARYAYPPLGLGLTASTESFRGPPGVAQPIRLGPVRGRSWDPNRAIAFLRNAVADTFVLGRVELGLDEMDDHHAVVHLWKSDLAAKDLEPFASLAVELAMRIDSARARLGSLFMAHLDESWSAFAAELEGSFDAATGRIAGRFEGGEIEIVPGMMETGRHAVTRMIHRPARPIDAALRFDTVAGDAPPSVDATMSTLLADALYAAVRRGEVVVDIPPFDEPEAMKAVLKRMSALASQLADVAPYR
jgi:hypothetical protein